MFHVSAYQFSLHLRRLRRWDRGWPATIDRFVGSTCACLECSIENCSQNFGFGGKEENTHRGEGNYSLFYLFTIIFVKDFIQVKNRVENRAEFKVKGILTRKWRQGKEILLVGVIKLSKRKKGGREKSVSSVSVGSVTCHDNSLPLSATSVGFTGITALVAN